MSGRGQRGGGRHQGKADYGNLLESENSEH